MRTWSGSSSVTRPSNMFTVPMKSATKRVGRELVDLRAACPPARSGRGSSPRCASASVIASSWSCVTTMNVTPSCSWMLTSSNCVCSRSFLSRARRAAHRAAAASGRLTSARASATRWRWPPESWCGLRAPNSPSFTISSISATRRADLGAAAAFLLEAERDVLLHRHVREQRVGLEHHVDRPLVGRHARSCPAPSMKMRPRSGVSKPASMRSSVVLPRTRAAEQAEDLALRRCSARHC